MLRRWKIRAATKWTCTGLAMLILAVWIASGWYMLSCLWTSGGASRSIALATGQVSYTWASPPLQSPPVQLFRLRRWYGGRWRFGTESVKGSGRALQQYAAPLWPAFLVVAFPAVMLWRADRRLAKLRSGGCMKCGYDRRGLAVGVKCPECGALPTS